MSALAASDINNYLLATLQPLGIIGVCIFMTCLLRMAVTACVSKVPRPNKSVPKMPVLPSGVIQYSRVPKEGVFVEEKIPKGLLRRHSTKQGTWGLIRVTKGSLQYQINEPQVATFRLDAPSQGVIEPAILHEVKPLTSDVEFAVEFYRFPDTGPVEEKRE
jgi:tellurite resistance-related uncharacterized protein